MARSPSARRSPRPTRSRCASWKDSAPNRPGCSWGLRGKRAAFDSGAPSGLSGRGSDRLLFPVNALLSLAYSVLAKDLTITPSFQETRWDKVIECYALLERATDSPIHKMNRAIAVAEWKGPAAGLAVLDGFEPPTWLAGSYLWAAVLSDLNRRSGNTATAVRYRDIACKAAPTAAVRELLLRRLQMVVSN